MKEIEGFIVSNTTESIMILAGGLAILLLLFIIMAISHSQFKKKYYKLVGDMDNETIDNILLESNRELEEIRHNTEDIKGDVENIRTRLSLSLQNIGLVRYNAFGEMGPELSFSIALLDEYLNGVVITSIYGGAESVSYAKPIVKGNSEYSLSVEEMQAINKAIKGEFYSNSL